MYGGVASTDSSLSSEATGVAASSIAHNVGRTRTVVDVRMDMQSQVASPSTGRPLSYSAPILASRLPSSLPSSPVTLRTLVLGDTALRPPSPLHLRRRAQSLGVPPPPGKRNPSTALGHKFLNGFDRARAREAQRVNDAMVYLDGAQIYSCSHCRTHLTSHDDIISKSFHGRHGRAYLFDKCVNLTIGPAEDRPLITGLHSVSDIFCKRCETVVGWTYIKAYEASQKYKEGKFIIEKINLHLEESDYYDAAHPAGEKTDRWRKRSMSWGGDTPANQSIVFEYQPPSGP